MGCMGAGCVTERQRRVASWLESADVTQQFVEKHPIVSAVQLIFIAIEYVLSIPAIDQPIESVPIEFLAIEQRFPADDLALDAFVGDDSASLL